MSATVALLLSSVVKSLIHIQLQLYDYSMMQHITNMSCITACWPCHTFTELERGLWVTVATECQTPAMKKLCWQQYYDPVGARIKNVKPLHHHLHDNDTNDVKKTMRYLLWSLECGLSLLGQIQYKLVQGISWLSKNALIIIRCPPLHIKLLVR